jgi:Flp pilus assembly protein TadG
MIDHIRNVVRALRGKEPRSTAGLAAVEFALLAPALLMLIFAIIIYSLYFAAYMGVRQATVEGARAAVTGMSTSERSQLAIAQATSVLSGYGSLMGTSAPPVITAQEQGTGLFRVTVTYNISSSPLLKYGSFLPMPSSTITCQVTVANGSY